MPSSAVQPLLALVASPVGGNPTQYMFEKAFAFHDLDWRYLTFEVAPANLEHAMFGLRALGFCGLHCGEPHKQAIMPLLDRTTETAAAVGAVNLAFRQDGQWVGDNIEGKAVVDCLAKVTDVAGKRVALLGAGRMARAVGLELAAAGAAALTLVNRTPEHAEELSALLAGKFAEPVAAIAWTPDFAVAPEIEVLIHATHLEHETDDAALPLNPEALRPELLVADVTVDKPHSWLLQEAQQRNCPTVDGLSIFIHQIALAFQLWTGVEPERQVLREAVEEFWEL